MSDVSAGRQERVRIVEAEAGHPIPALIEPTAYGYLRLAARVQPGPGGLPVVLPSRRRTELLTELKRQVAELTQVGDVVRASVYRTVVLPPTARFSSYLRRRRSEGTLRPADFDVIVLIEATSPASARHLDDTAPYGRLLDLLRERAESVDVALAHNARRIGDVDTSRPGLFLFNHFAADDREVMLDLWEHLAGWYAAETGLDNSVALAPDDTSDYALINWARWDERLLVHFWHQLAKRSFWKYVTANLEANHAGSMPVYCRLVAASSA